MANTPFFKGGGDEAPAPDVVADSAPEAPQNRDDAIQAALEPEAAEPEAEPSTPVEDSEPETSTPVEDEPAEEPESEDLFPEEPAEEPDDVSEELDDDGGDLFEDEAEPKKARTVPYKRLQRVIGERNTLREENGSLRDQLSKAQELNSTVFDRYKTYENPAGQLGWDVDFLEKWTELSPNNPDLQKAGQIVMDALDGKETAVSTPAPAAPEATEPARDPAFQKYLEREAERTIVEVLDGIKPQFQKLITKHIVSSDIPLEDITPAVVKRQANEFRRDNNFSAADMMTKPPAPPKEDPEPANDAPADGSPSQASTRPRRARKAKEDDAPRPPQSRSEWEANREDRMRAMFGE